MLEINYRNYQKEDIQDMIRLGRVYNANIPGAGKTLECLTFIKEKECQRVLVICPKAAKGVWAYEADHWFGWSSTVLEGTPTQREAQLQNFDSRFLIINIQQLEEVLRFYETWDIIIIDEIHALGLLNHKTKAFKTVQKAKSTYFIPMTGTPIRSTPADLFAPLHLIAPKRFPSYWAFVNTWCIVHEGPFGKEILNKPKNPVALQEMLRKYMVRQPAEVVQAELPDKLRHIIPFEMDKKQKAAYNQLMEEMMLDLDNGDILLTSGELVKGLRLRQLLISPELVGLKTVGGALDMLVNELLPADFDEGNSIAICTPFRQAIPFIRHALNKKFQNDIFIEEIHGEIDEAAATVAMRFQQHPSAKKILIFTTASGFSWTAHAASTMYCLGSSYSYVQQLQAENRIHRVGQTKTTHINYLVCRGTIDELIISALEQKHSAEEWVIKPEDLLAQLQKFREDNLK